jgi:outer membrane protein OmpA-like peptidoglycan-associated protein
MTCTAKPVGSNATNDGRALNRRVEISVYPPESK